MFVTSFYDNIHVFELGQVIILYTYCIDNLFKLRYTTYVLDNTSTAVNTSSHNTALIK